MSETVFGNRKLFKMIKNVFYFMLEALFVLFYHLGKGLDKKAKVNFTICSAKD